MGKMEMMDNNHQVSGTSGIPANRSTGFYNVYVDTVIEEEEDEIDEKDVLRVTIQSKLSAEMHNDNLCPELINEDGEYEREENGIYQMEGHSDPWSGSERLKPLILSKFDQQEETNMSCQQQIKKEEIPINISEVLYKGNLHIKEEGMDEKEGRDIQQIAYSDTCTESDVKSSSFLNHKQEGDVIMKVQQQVKEEEIPVNISKGLHDGDVYTVSINEEGRYKTEENTTQQMESQSDLCAGGSMKHFVIRTVSLTESYEGSVGLKKEESKSTQHLNNELNSGLEKCLTKPYLPKNKGNISKEGTVVCLKNESEETTKAMGNHSILVKKCSEYNESTPSCDSQFLAHKSLTTGQKTFVCSECGKCFNRKCNLVYHEKMHTWVKPFTCSECGKCFSQKYHLISHARIHTAEKPFACSECGKCFIQKSHLVYHARTHTCEKPFACKICGKCFSQTSHLVSHERIHTCEKPFACSECEKCFRQKGDLVRHERSHKGLKPFACSECGKCFSRKSNLISHEKTHRDEK
ncbi:uncharacterized protein O3C94_016740 [Discoglossus pictus]